MARGADVSTRGVGALSTAGLAAALLIAGCTPTSAGSAPESTSVRATNQTTATATATTTTGTATVTGHVAHAELGDVAVERVRAVLGSAAPHEVRIETPATPEDFARIAGGSVEALRDVAAVTTGPRDTGGQGPDRIVLNPVAFGRLSPEGQQFVITHESVHVALRASEPGQLSPWLAEGFADHVGYAATGRSRTELAAELLTAVRAGAGPRTLPTPADFEPGSGDLAQAYLGAWLAVEEIADRHGAPQLLRLIRAASATPGEDPELSLDRALDQVLHTTRAELTAQWLASLQRLSRHPS